MPYELLIALLVGLTVASVGGAVLLIQAARRAPLLARLDAIETTATIIDAPVKKGVWLSTLFKRLGTFFLARKNSEGLREQLAQAGFSDKSAPAIFLGSKILLLLVGLMGGSVVYFVATRGDVSSTPLPLVGMLVKGLNNSPMFRLTFFAGAGVIPFFIPNFYVFMHRQKRAFEIQSHLPDAIDMLEICISAGMGMEQAWIAVSDEIRTVSPVLADEMALTELEIHLGSSRVVAMRHMAQRTGSQDLASLVAILVQSERFGTPISDALRTFAAAMRDNRSHRAQEQAEKMAVKLIFPMVLCIFPAVVIVMAGPAVMALSRALAN